MKQSVQQSVQSGNDWEGILFVVKQIPYLVYPCKWCSIFNRNLYCCFCFWVLQFNFNKTKYIVQIMKCKLPMKINKNERGIWGVWIWPHWNVLSFPWAWDICINYSFFRQHYRIILVASLGKIYSRILGRVATIFLIIWNKNPSMRKEYAMMFSLCLLVTWNILSETTEIHSVNRSEIFQSIEKKKHKNLDKFIFSYLLI